MSKKGISGFNTTLQKVEDRYEWINGMIIQRRELVLSYMNLLNDTVMRNIEGGKSDNELAAEITSFCEKLVDYLSHGHFDLFPKIFEITEQSSGRSLSIARRTLAAIDRNTESLTDFNDRYAEDIYSDRLDSLPEEIEKLGALLESRFRLEDRLIIGLRLVHNEAAENQ